MPILSLLHDDSTNAAWVHHYPANVHGRDFVVGDLHGCVLPLLQALDFLAFDPSIDRVFSVGDLIDRGPYSLESLKLLKRPWFRATMGNHEEWLVQHLQNPSVIPPYESEWLDEQGSRLSDRMQFADTWLPLLQALPLVIVVGEGTQRYNVVHAEMLDLHTPVTDAMIDHWAFTDHAKAQKRAIWGRALIKTHRRQRSIERAHHPRLLSPTYCGHSIVEGPLQVGQQIYLDQGAYLAFESDSTGPGQRWHDHEAGLVLAEPKTKRFWFVPSDPASHGHVRSERLLIP